MTDRLLIFDFDGVVADSEVAANALLAQAISAIGHPTTLEDCLHHYMGRRWSDCVLAIEGRIGRPLPPGFEAARRAEMEAHETELHAVAGVAAFIERFGHLRRCVASSSAPPYLHRVLAQLGLAHWFGEAVFSGTQVARGKPFPDLFLHAAACMGVPPEHCLVIEDSPTGVRAGVAAGMTTLGLCAGAHIRDGHAERLLSAGAESVAHTYEEAATFVDRWLQRDGSTPA